MNKLYSGKFPLLNWRLKNSANEPQVSFVQIFAAVKTSRHVRQYKIIAMEIYLKGIFVALFIPLFSCLKNGDKNRSMEVLNCDLAKSPLNFTYMKLQWACKKFCPNIKGCLAQCCRKYFELISICLEFLKLLRNTIDIIFVGEKPGTCAAPP